MKFTKMQGAGNDFIVINNMEENININDLGSIAKKLCSRRFSIGADGMMVVDYPDQGGDYKMRFYNADGSLGEMCGNGARCICCYGYEKGLTGETQRVETTAGMVTGERIHSREYKIKLNNISVMNLDHKVKIGDKTILVDYIELGNPGLPHGVIEIPGLSHMNKEELRQLGKELRYHNDFKKGMNVNFYEITGKDKIVELTYERGVEDFTLACGTGTGSVVSVLTEKKLVSGKNVEVKVPGGKLIIDINDVEKPGEDIFLTGPVKIVAEGTVCD